MQEIDSKMKALNPFAVEKKDKSLKMFTNRKCGQTSFGKVELKVTDLVLNVTQNIALPPPLFS